MNEYSYQERHMGTSVSLSFVCPQATLADAIAAQVFAAIHASELRFSRFLPDSELSQLNEKGTLAVSADFIKVLERSLVLHSLTKGAFNPLLQVKALGYTKTFDELKNTTAALSPTAYNTDLEKVRIDHAARTVTLAENQQLDFGGVLKGYLATRLADEIKETYPACTGLVINIGGDLATRGYDELHEPFIFRLYNPVTGEEIPTIITDRALATSGTYARAWQTSVGPRHHIVDARSLKNPTQNIVAVSIIHRDGATAEALAKLFLVAGATEALDQVPTETHDYQYFIVFNDGNIFSNLM